MSLPILYTFRRCPYAIRARIVLAYCEIKVNQVEVFLNDKPQAMLDISPKGTVPVLVLNDGKVNDGKVIDESIDIIHWALAQTDQDNWYHGLNDEHHQQINSLIDSNDNEFKPMLDNYKYASRFPELSVEEHRNNAAFFLIRLDALLADNKFLCGDDITLADIAIFPFIRQFIFVDKKWFDQSLYQHLRTWINHWLEHELFLSVMQKT